MLNCKQITELCSDELDRALRLGEKVSLRAHLMMCSGCTNYRKQMKALREVMRAYAEGRAISVEAKTESSD
jgi:predicted anti-sigma-YlaC factor YlaD